MTDWRILLAVLAVFCWSVQAYAADGSAGNGSGQNPTESWRANAEIVQAYDTANQAFEAGDYPTASSGFEALLVGQPKNAEFRLKLAKCHIELDETESAIAQYNTVLFYHPNNVKAKLGLSHSLAIAGRFIESLAIAEDIYLDEDYYIDAMVAKAHAYWLAGNLESSFNWVGEALHFEPNHSGAQAMSRRLLAGGGGQAGIGEDATLDQLAENAFVTGNNEEARRLGQELVASGSTDPVAWYRLGKLQEWDQDWDSAVASYEQVILLDPENYDAAMRRAKIFWFDGYNCKSIDAFEEFINIPDLPSGFYEQAIRTYAGALRSGGLAWQAVEMYRKALEFTPEDVELRAALASTLAGLRCFNDALCEANIALEYDPHNPAAWLAMGSIQAWQGNPQDALWMYNKVRPGNAYYPAAQTGRASALNAMGRRNDALMALGRVLALYPDDEGANALVCALYEIPDPVLSTRWSQSHDTDDNDYVGQSVYIIIPFDPTGKVVSIRFDEFTLDNTIRNEKSTGQSFRANLVLPVNETSKVRLGGSVVEVDNGVDPDLSEFNWNAQYEWTPRAGYRANIGFSDNVLYSTTHLARTAIRLRNLWGQAGVEVGDDLWFSARYSDGNLSDGNDRQELNLKLQQSDLVPGEGRANYGVNFQSLRFAQDLDNGYWDPDEYKHTELFLDWTDLSNRDVKLDGSFGWGISKDTALAGRQSFRYKLGLRVLALDDRLTLRGGYESSDTATSASSGPGYESENWYFGADWKL